MKRIIKKCREPFVYSLIGVLATAIDFTALIILTDIVKIDYRISLALAFIVAAFFNFQLQKKITFKCKDSAVGKQFLQFLGLGTIGLGINFVIITVSVEFFQIWYVTGKLGATGIAFVWNYVANKLITFNKNV